MVSKIYEIGIVPVVVLGDSNSAVPLAQALCAGGLPTAEVTFRTGAAKEAIRKIAGQVPQITVGAGTITTVDMARAAADAGAKYIVSPGFNPRVVHWCLEHEIPVFPGVSSPSEVEAAMELGLTTLKFFPAEQVGGRPMLSSLAAPYANIKFMPTGGINLDNLNAYLALPNVVACGGSWICPTGLTDLQQFDKIETLCREAVLRMHNFSLLHVGINSADAARADQTATLFAQMFSLPKQELPSAYFAGTMLEVVKSQFLGEHGHIAISTDNIDRAIAYFKRGGYHFRAEGLAKDSKGIIAAYFEQELGGFAIHLRRKL